MTIANDYLSEPERQEFLFEFLGELAISPNSMMGIWKSFEAKFSYGTIF